jgi:hypothetical protein
MNSRPALRVSAIALLAIGFSASAVAQPTEAQTGAIKQNCRSDFLSHCRGVPTGGAEAFQCLKKNEAALSAGCRAAVGAIGAPAQANPAAPAQPAAATPAPTRSEPAANPTAPVHAAPAAPPPPAAAAPAAAPAVAAAPAAPRPAEPKPAATAAVPAQPSAAQQNAIKQNCRNDFMAHCAGVQPGGTEAFNCLKTNTAKLTPACKSAVAAIGAPAATKPAVATVAPPAAAPAAPAAAAMPTPRIDNLQEAQLIKRFCFTDFKVLCAGVRPGQGRAVQCLAAHAPSLSPGCKAAMASASR